MPTSLKKKLSSFGLAFGESGLALVENSSGFLLSSGGFGFSGLACGMSTSVRNLALFLNSSLSSGCVALNVGDLLLLLVDLQCRTMHHDDLRVSAKGFAGILAGLKSSGFSLSSFGLAFGESGAKKGFCLALVEAVVGLSGWGMVASIGGWLGMVASLIT